MAWRGVAGAWWMRLKAAAGAASADRSLYAATLTRATTYDLALTRAATYNATLDRQTLYEVL